MERALEERSGEKGSDLRVIGCSGCSGPGVSSSEGLSVGQLTAKRTRTDKLAASLSPFCHFVRFPRLKRGPSEQLSRLS